MGGARSGQNTGDSSIGAATFPPQKPHPRRPWNPSLLLGPKPPFKPDYIWAIRSRLQHEGRDHIKEPHS
ncbi:hypothetical protein FV232_10720 [Methylobacterium sp. WL30]|nr:hypothetical protein FV227_10725 [Methylobacterium sp. WL119]TXN67838.1 hypothetical protein FV232_10720 [Methylobacterium sp. WL30]